jgi:hypothetical protein
LEDWPRAKDLIVLSMGEGSYSEVDVVRHLLHGSWTLWIIEKEGEVVSACITEIIDFPRKRKCLLRYAAGKIEHLNEHSPKMEAYAMANGCDVLEAYTRRGMAKLKPDWEQKYIILQKDLT